MAEMNPDDIASKQVRNTSNAVDDFRSGVDRVDEAPTRRAAAAIDKMRAGFEEAARSGKIQNRLNAVSLDAWKQRTLDKSDRIAPGVEAAQQDIAAFHRQRQQFQNNINRELDQIPSDSLQNNIRRMTTQVQRMAKFQFNPSGSQ